MEGKKNRNNKMLIKCSHRKGLKAGALYFAVFISFISGIFVVFLLLNAYLNSKIANIELHKDKVIRDVNSAIALLQGNPEIVGYNSQQEMDLFNDGHSTVTVARKRFGAYNVVSAEEKMGDYLYIKTGLTGENMQQGEQTGLYMTDRNKYLSLSGKTKLSGTCYLPALGIRRAYIEGQGYTGDELVDGVTKKSSDSLPGIDRQLFSYLAGYLEGNYEDNDSVADFNEMATNNPMKRSFQKSMLVLRSQEIIVIGDQDISGNISVVSDRGILVKSRAKISDIVLYAPNIYIEPGFTGNIQAFASDTLVIGNNCRLNYPSFAGIVNKNVNNCYMRIEKAGTVSGGILIFQDSKALREPYLYIEESVIIYGQVYCKGMVEHKGTIFGSLYCDGFVLKTPSAYYENHLLNAMVDAKNLSRYFTGACIFEPSSKSQQLIKWLN